jgi:hypothetical protein
MTALAPLLAAIVWAACSANALADRKIDLAQLKVGSHCELQTMVSRDGMSRTIYLGTVKELTRTSVTLVDVTVTHRADKTPPVLGSIPYLKRFFRTVGVGRSRLSEKSVEIPLKDIAWNEAVSADEFRMRSAISVKTSQVKHVLP